MKDKRNLYVQLEYQYLKQLNPTMFTYIDFYTRHLMKSKENVVNAVDKPLDYTTLVWYIRKSIDFLDLYTVYRGIY